VAILIDFYFPQAPQLISIPFQAAVTEYIISEIPSVIKAFPMGKAAPQVNAHIPHPITN